MRDFLSLLERKGQLKRIKKVVDPDLELAAISDRVLGMGGPALLFENVVGSPVPVAVNLLGTVERVTWSMGLDSIEQLEKLGEKLSKLQNPAPPKNLKKTIEYGGLIWDLLKAFPDRELIPPCHQRILKGDLVDLDTLPLIRPWPGDAGKVITFGLVITKDPETKTPNVGVYRLQQQSKQTMTVHWLSVRGGARHLRKAAAMGKKLEIAIAIGVHPLLVMAAATPIPAQLSEWLFAGLYAGKGVHLTKCKTIDLEVPSHSEIVLEGTISPGEKMKDGPFGDHMGFYGGEEESPLIRIHCLTRRKNPIFLTTFSGRPPKEEAMLALALNRIYTPVLRQQVPEINDFFLPMESLSYKLAVISIKKAYPGQIIQYTVSPVFGMKIKWVTEITQVKRNSYFIDEQRFGPYSFWHHKHFIKEIDNGILMDDIIHYKIPFGFIGKILNKVYVQNKLNKIFKYRENKLNEIFGNYTN